ncbi:activating transcription factor 7-interacting protein 2 isoform X6 [Petaurus breviceps papuanus]|uniref:activating transcription factor 7-interacting protein 2 isoform X6 n=1 Tax=Petaurus breviceps papuanus TaxID=3040969 RepID=UPI0036DA7B63
MASPDPPVQKKLKAKKTIRTSCWKQAYVLRKSENTEPLKAAEKNNVHSGNQQLSTDVMHRKSENSDMKCFLLDSKKTIVPQENETFPQNLAISLKTVNNNSNMNFVNERVINPNSRPAETEDSLKNLFTQDSSDSQRTSCGSEHKTNEQNQVKIDLNLKPSSSSSGPLNDLIDKSAYISGSHVEKTFKSVGNGKENNQVGPRLEVTSQSESHSSQQSEAISIKSSNSHLMADKTSDLKTSVQARKDTSDFLKTQEYSQTDHSSTSDCGNTVSAWHSSFDANNSTSKKRILSGNKENTKRMKTANEINENICIVEKESSLFAQRKISKLDRCIKAALTVQKTGLESKTPAQNVICEVTNSKTVILNKNQEAEKESPSVKLTSLNNKSSRPSEISVNKAKQKNNLTSDCDEVSESNNADVMLISEENDNLKAPVTRTADAEKMVLANSNDSLDSKTKSKASREKMKLETLVIDLTEEANLNDKTATSVEVLELPVATNEKLMEKNSVVQDSVQVVESFEHLPSLPELPQHRDLRGLNDFLPPQKFELRLKRVLRPKGIALTWNTSHINPRCAPVESYLLYIYHDNNVNKNKTTWKKIGEIKALPLPMACSLSQFLSSGTYYFTLQARDIYGRYGPFCDVKYIHGFSQDNINTSKVLPT